MKKSFPFAWNQPEGTLLYTDFLFKTHVEKYQEVLLVLVFRSNPMTFIVGT